MSKTYVSASLRRMVCDRANGYCEYCLIPETLALSSHQIDHIIAEKHSGETVESNLALSCSICNKNKGSDIASIDPETGEVVRLYNPRKDSWEDHFQIQTENGTIQPLTAIGRVTVRLLQVNRAEYLIERKLSIKIQSLTKSD
ncbi:MAG: HNH endonuclease [Microcoleus sp. PH2017_29_MFU_D_A]|uniref:HNH endonuclease n=1 Tax=unclassified Microcoleus TaxID=2642155 RepID=UPI001DB60FB1|nr:MULTISPECIES: HNH endonuclease signature motif containing protein [unclassified Microcoleus]MCC3419868.1 HNH endonuclease [Microcoleus sp. PH2017_07_MST_O_A]MCC3513685.1 HNH endonuclease [Microcoleus sp. PH2017_17_BER_D_A]TAG66461.1 MAG: HNH endonuclease [Oscillatoriales cyanobacterium]MCC3426351.1 HNH endonuclease [Microcoleus sp. PH2017_01_SCD_O_A]MCC3457124.1 HNH endonuclease [Microcoleus sp. PH2017_08_TRC_O_A]